MSSNGWFQLAFYMAVLLALVKPLGLYMSRVYQGSPFRWLGTVERFVYRLLGVDPSAEMSWKSYAVAMLVFNGVGLLVIFGLQVFQDLLPLNPQGLGSVPPDLAFNTAVSFASNTNWQAYGGETTMSYFTQAIGLNVQNFLSAATGMAILIAFIRGLSRRSADMIGSFWVDLTRSILHILLPLSLLLAVMLVSQGVVQNLRQYQTVQRLEPVTEVGGRLLTTQTLPMGPAASQVAIKQLGTNGGGFFNTNSSHPFENPTPLSNFLEMLAILLIPAALCYTFGHMTGDVRQGWAVLAAMTLIFLGALALCYAAESHGNPRLARLGADQGYRDPHPSTRISSRWGTLPDGEIQPDCQGGGNMEGKEVRFGTVNSALWATATTAASNGSVNAMHDSFTPLGGLVPMLMMQLGEVVFGGVGCGLYGMLIFAMLAVFVAGLMVGRTPEYLGKKIEPFEMKMTSFVILLPPLLVLVGTAVAVITDEGRTGMANPGEHGFSEVLYAFSSAGNNNGSAFAGLSANSTFYNLALGIAMFLARYWLAVPVLAIAGSLARKKLVPPGPGTLPTHTPLFVGLLIAIVLIVGALTFIPSLALGPIVEHLLQSGA